MSCKKKELEFSSIFLLCEPEKFFFVVVFANGDFCQSWERLMHTERIFITLFTYTLGTSTYYDENAFVLTSVHTLLVKK